MLDIAIQLAAHAFDTAEAERNSSAGPIDFERPMAEISPPTVIIGSVGNAPSPPGALATNGAHSRAGGSPPISSFIDGFLEDDKEHVSGGTAMISDLAQGSGSRTWTRRAEPA
jgi:hypothetical protein